MIDFLVGWLAEIGCLIVWLIDWLIERLIDCLIGCLLACLPCRFD